MTATRSTADAADSWVKGQAPHTQAQLARQEAWQRLLDVFRGRGLTEDELGRVSVIAEVAIDQVFSAYNLDDQACRERHPLVKDYAECSSLYGYALGLADGLAQGRAERQQA